MLIASFSVTPAQRPHSGRVRNDPPRRAVPAHALKPSVGFLLAWTILGSVVLLCIPAARGDQLLGATLPFWLVVAPIVDLAWIDRRRIADRLRVFSRALAARVRVAIGKPRMARNVRRQGAARSFACSAARS